MTLSVDMWIFIGVLVAIVLLLAGVLWVAKEEFGKFMKDILTSAAGDYDPARAIGYGVVLLCVLFFLVLATYDTYLNHHLDYSGFTASLLAIGTLIAGAAAGVWIKKGTEVQPTPPQSIDVHDLVDLLKSTTKKDSPDQG